MFVINTYRVIYIYFIDKQIEDNVLFNHTHTAPRGGGGGGQTNWTTTAHRIHTRKLIYSYMMTS